MRKIFTTLKSVVAVALIAAMTLAASCSYDDSAIQKDVDKIKQDLAALTERVDALEDKLDEQVASLTELINGKVVVVDVVTDNEIYAADASGLYSISVTDVSGFTNVWATILA